MPGTVLHAEDTKESTKQILPQTEAMCSLGRWRGEVMCALGRWRGEVICALGRWRGDLSLMLTTAVLSAPGLQSPAHGTDPGNLDMGLYFPSLGNR